jgi:hypothetical protein
MKLKGKTFKFNLFNIRSELIISISVISILGMLQLQCSQFCISHVNTCFRVP